MLSAAHAADLYRHVEGVISMSMQIVCTCLYITTTHCSAHAMIYVYGKGSSARSIIFIANHTQYTEPLMRAGDYK